MRIRHPLLILFIIILISLFVGGFFFLRSPYFLNKIRVVLENQLEKQIKQPLLFSLKLKFQSDLDNEIFSVELRRAFEKNGIPLPQNVTLSAKEKGIKWLITDEDKQQGYTIRKETDALNIYKRLARIGRISGNILTGLNIQGFEIADGKSQNPPVVSIDEVGFRYKLWGLLVGKFLVSNLNIKRPEINAYIQPNGKLNLTELIPEKKASSVKFPFRSAFSRIKVENGIINFADNNQNLKLTISGLYINIKGPLDKWKHRGDLEVRDGSFELNGIETQIDELKTEFEFLEDEGELKELRLATGNSTLIISGKASHLKEKSPSVEARINLDLDLQDLQKFFPNLYDTEGTAQIDIEAKGTFSEITGQFGLKLPFARLNQIQIENLIAQAEFTQDTFRLTEIKGTLASGQLTGGAEIHTVKQGSSLGYDGWLEFAGIQAEELVPMIIGIPESFLVVKGDVNGKLQFEGDSHDPRDLRLSGDLQFTNATLNDESILPSEANYQIADNRLKLTANLDEAQIQLAGTLGLKQDESGDQLNLDLNIQQIDVGKLTREILDVIDLVGNGTFTGKITSEIPIAGLLSIPKATLYDVPIGVLTADFHYKDGSVMLH
ncbi:hypothetical protein IH992_23440, partial [Candidatus Poribacteria bacterium]|nr:hypothetical protein [Candidatus Poribacteria bacterium]